MHRLPALAITALEMMEFGEKYADQVIAKLKTLIVHPVHLKRL